MKILSMDLETYSSVELTKSGVYAYCESDDFKILLLAYAEDDEDVQVVDIASGEKVPEDIVKVLEDPAVIKTAYNAQFERTCLAVHFKKPMPPEQWKCSQVHALMLGLPGYLDGVAKCLRLKEQKMKEGKALIRYFSMPCKPTKVNGGRTRNLPQHDKEKWNTFKDYCKQDVQVERLIRKKLEAFPIPEVEQKLWELDQKINDRGIQLDKALVMHAIKCDEAYQKKLLNEAKHLTRIDNPNSPAQLKKWIKDLHGIEVESLAKEKVAELLEETEIEDVRHLLELRQEMSKTSVKKYEAMDRVMRKDERAGGLLQFYGANRTGRWCLAEGTLVLVKTPKNEITQRSIQEVAITDLVWDGNEWVRHEGVVYSGDKEVITWDGVTATPNHIVYLSDKESVILGEAKEGRLRLWRGHMTF